MGFEREVSCVEEMDFDVGVVALERLGAGRQEKGIMLAPDGEEGRPVGGEVRVEFRIKRDIARIVQEEIELDLVITRARQKRVIEPIGFRRDRRLVGNAVDILPLGPFEGQERADCIPVFRRGVAPYFWMGAQPSLRPSSYALPFCEMIAVTRSGREIARRKPTGAP